MTISGYIALGVILIMIVALIREVLRPGLILFSALVVFMVADIISFIRQKALGDALLSHKERIGNAMKITSF